MGYDMQLSVFKKKTLECIEKELEPEKYSFSVIFSECLYAWLYPEEYKIPEGEEGRYICSENINIFKDFFGGKVENCEAIIIDEETYNCMFTWLGIKLKSMNLFDFVDDPEAKYMIYPYIRTYRNMRDANVNFDEEFVVFEHDW